MTEGIKTIIYPVKDIAQAKTLYRRKHATSRMGPSSSAIMHTRVKRLTG